MNKTFVAIDFETATRKYNSACSIGIVLFNKNSIINEYYYLIKPPNNEYHKDNINIHKITPDDTKDEPTFDVIWNEIKELFNGEHIIIAQNANFDMSVLKSTLEDLNIELPEFTYWDSIKIATYIVPNDVKKGLASLTQYFNLALDTHHNALCDARACAEVCIICFNEMTKNSYYVKKDGNLKKYIEKKLDNSFSELEAKQIFKSRKSKNKGFGKNYKKFVNANNYQQNKNADKKNLFYNKNIAVTGDISGFSRNELFDVISNNGGIIKNSVTKQTDILIIGKQDLSLVGDNGKSSKEKKAISYISKGIDITILNEDKTLEFLNTLI